MFRISLLAFALLVCFIAVSAEEPQDHDLSNTVSDLASLRRDVRSPVASTKKKSKRGDKKARRKKKKGPNSKRRISKKNSKRPKKKSGSNQNRRKNNGNKNIQRKRKSKKPKSRRKSKKKPQKIKIAKKNDRRRTKPHKCSRQTGADDSTCLANVETAMDYEGKQIKNFKNQKKRIEDFDKLMKNKGGKKENFQNTTAYMKEALGSDNSCNGTTNKIDAQTAVSTHTTLSNCSTSVDEGCSIPSNTYNSTDLASCENSFTAVATKNAECYMLTTATSPDLSAACTCWAAAAALVETTKALKCSAVSSYQSMIDLKKTCLSKFSECKKAEDASVGLIQVCNGRTTPSTASVPSPAPAAAPTSTAADVRVRKNLTTLTNEELHDLIHALIEAKKYGTYEGAPISGQADIHSSNFTSSYDAAASFHGYPALCGRPNANATTDGGCCIHGYSTFLPWHRLFMIQLEDSLRANPKYNHVTLPYWDWTPLFDELPHLVRNPSIADPTNPSKILQNPFYHSWIPGQNYTRRSPYVLTNYTHHNCVENMADCQNATQNWPGYSVLMDLTLTAFEETEYEGFETQIEFPHNMFHNQLGFTPDTKACYENGTCYPYTMGNNYYSSFDPIFLIFHVMVDFQWAVFQKLQEYRGIPYASDCHPGFNGELAPFNGEMNSNLMTKSHSRGKHTLNTNTLRYEYDNLTLNGMGIPELDEFLKKRQNNDRLFAVFPFASIKVKKIVFRICPDSDCSVPSPYLTITKDYKRPQTESAVSPLLYHEVTKYLPAMNLEPNQDIRFQIVSSSVPAKVTFAPFSLFRQGGSNKERITVHWQEEHMDFNYASYFKVRQNRNASIRFLLKNGSQAVYQYNSQNSMNTCYENDRTLVQQEIEIEKNKQYFFQNPLLACEEGSKLEADRTSTCTWGNIKREENGNATIGWQLDMSKYSEGICMEKGTFLTFYWRRDYHWVTAFTDPTDFNSCNIDWTYPKGTGCPNQGQQYPCMLTYPPEGFQEEKTYYFACPVGNGAHCNQGMKLKIHVKTICPNE